MKKIEARELKNMGATEQQIKIYSESDPLSIYFDGAAYDVKGVVEARKCSARDVLDLLDALAEASADA